MVILPKRSIWEIQKSFPRSPSRPRIDLGAIMSLDLTTMKSATVLEETDTTYQLVGADEVKNILNFKATKNKFTKACPRAEDALICSQKTVTDRTLPLP